MAFTINTNIASLQAQENLRQTSELQSKTINRVTSGLRIINSGDDAAGLAIANGYRSDISVLTQGVRNANDGLSQLQIIDGGMSNISKLLDRARTLATQSASGTFTGDRNVLNDEFKSVIGELERQSVNIGLNVGGTFAKELKVFIGGGKGDSDPEIQANGAVKVDLSNSTVDAQSLGLKGVQAKGTADLSGTNTNTTVTAILADPANTTSLSNVGYTEFYIMGPGFDEYGSSGIKLAVNTNGVTSASQLANAINAAIDSAGSAATQEATAFKNAGIRASIIKDATTGAENLSFDSSTTAFQVRAGDQVASALMGKVSGSAGELAFSKFAFDLQATAATAGQIDITFEGGSLSNIGITPSANTGAAWAAALNTALAASSAAADFYAVAVDADTFSLVSRSGKDFSVNVDTQGSLVATGSANYSVVDAGSWFNSGGAYVADGKTNGAFSWTNVTTAGAKQSITLTATDDQGTLHSLSIELNTTTGANIDKAIDEINDKIRTNADPTSQNIVVLKDTDSNGGRSAIRFSSTLPNFSISVGEGGNDEGIGGTTDQGHTFSAAVSGTGSTADISTESGALDAVSALQSGRIPRQSASSCW